MVDTEKEQAIFNRFFSETAVKPAEIDETLNAEQRIFVRFYVLPKAQPDQPAAKTSPESLASGTDAAPQHSPVAADQETAKTPVAPDKPQVAAEPAAIAAFETQDKSTAFAGTGLEQEAGFFKRVKKGLSRTRESFTKGMANILIGQKEIDDELIEDIETQLLVADVGIEATTRIMKALAERVSRKELFDANALYVALQEELKAVLQKDNDRFVVDTSKKPYVILMVGVNGVGKTTTIGKLAKRLDKEGHTVMLAAGDTFRAAAVEQLQVWGGRNDIPVIAQHTGADSASVIYDAMQAAQARKVDVLIADTAGRLHNKANLMEELKKVRRVLSKLDPEAPHEVMLVLDAATGQNALNQCQQFDDSVGVTSIALTKLDGTAKGGVVFSIAAKADIPIKFIGVGEQIDDLRPFDPQEFVEALFAEDE